jgi:cobalt-zinc-cadmium efflux system membrane fusion protein
MTLRQLAATLLFALALTACGERSEDHADGDEHAEAGHGDDHAEEEVVKGEHNGRLLTQGDHALELAIFEDGVPPEYRVWLYHDGKQLPPSAGQVTVVLNRLGGRTDTHTFKPQDDFLRTPSMSR